MQKLVLHEVIRFPEIINLVKETPDFTCARMFRLFENPMNILNKLIRNLFERKEPENYFNT